MEQAQHTDHNMTEMVQNITNLAQENEDQANEHAAGNAAGLMNESPEIHALNEARDADAELRIPKLVLAASSHRDTGQDGDDWYQPVNTLAISRPNTVQDYRVENDNASHGVGPLDANVLNTDGGENDVDIYGRRHHIPPVTDMMNTVLPEFSSITEPEPGPAEAGRLSPEITSLCPADTMPGPAQGAALVNPFSMPARPPSAQQVDRVDRPNDSGPAEPGPSNGREKQKRKPKQPSVSDLLAEKFARAERLAFVRSKLTTLMSLIHYLDRRLDRRPIAQIAWCMPERFDFRIKASKSLKLNADDRKSLKKKMLKHEIATIDANIAAIEAEIITLEADVRDHITHPPSKTDLIIRQADAPGEVDDDIEVSLDSILPEGVTAEESKPGDIAFSREENYQMHLARSCAEGSVAALDFVLALLGVVPEADMDVKATTKRILKKPHVSFRSGEVLNVAARKQVSRANGKALDADTNTVEVELARLEAARHGRQRRFYSILEQGLSAPRKRKDGAGDDNEGKRSRGPDRDFDDDPVFVISNYFRVMSGIEGLEVREEPVEPAGPPNRQLHQAFVAAVNNDGSRTRKMISAGVLPTATYKGVSLLGHACKAGSDSAAEILIDAGADLNVVDADGDTPLIRAIVGQHEKTAVVCVEKGADLTVTRRSSEPPLFVAVDAGLHKVVEAILSRVDCNVNAADSINETALAVACRTGQVEMVERLISAGADLNSTDSTGDTPLGLAICCMDTRAVKLLVEAGADCLKVVGQSGQAFSALYLAAEHDAVDIVHYILEKKPELLNYVDNGGRSPLFAASLFNSVETCRLLLQHHADCNLASDDSRTPLIVAAERNNTECIKLLLSAGASINAQDADGDTALMLACFYGRVESSRVLLEAGANCNVARADGVRAIYIATVRNNTALIKLLVENGAEINAQADNGRSALMEAVVQGHGAAVRALLATGADVNLPDSEGDSPLCAALADGDQEIVSALLHYGADCRALGRRGCSPIYLAAGHGHVSILKILLDTVPELVNQSDDLGLTPLFVASITSQVECINLLIRHGANLDLPSNEGQTPLLAAAVKGHTYVVNRLTQAGAVLDTQDEDGSTALLGSCIEGHTACVKLLLDAGADPNLSRPNGESPLSQAIARDYTAIVEMLVAVPGIDLNVPVAKDIEQEDEKHVSCSVCGVLGRVARSLLSALGRFM
ncbi:Ankyrin repeats (3 copies) [Carpediemonas membranifera]|uniref:Ankyrin repeats (3 copies) n=1 Tax=Carpediemonas membranifera TaxID=201153 RepID=A0A8J6E898_9EUKA|nr:Ankyrin repeats (3 copies) [Carpediemonas membranifera]|eukprot:KAG9391600.1 Ankyrin repeats (3 copies) [Carpediemonas membranifera]